ncbi:uncharacterized protein LOC134876139 isoform X3 [Eleginops maclovinus]|uniref:uncharacterized protein LOC134876139 isoform X3 n=1 Tax=Eleginops maclovinus TaxID=56733 RepID=UPI0030808945
MILNFVKVFLLWPLCVAQTSDISQPVPFQMVKIGDSATIECHIKEMIYFSRNGICQKKDSGKTTCVYGLLLRNFSSEDAATYYCVVTSCGQTLFGSGTRIYIQGKTFESQLNPTTIALGLSNIALGIMTVILVYTLCRRRGSTASTDGSSEGHQTSDVVTYTDPISLPRRQPAVRYCKGSVLYSEVRNCQPN